MQESLIFAQDEIEDLKWLLSNHSASEQFVVVEGSQVSSEKLENIKEYSATYEADEQTEQRRLTF